MHASSSVGTCILLSYTEITVYLLKRQGNALYIRHIWSALKVGSGVMVCIILFERISEHQKEGMSFTWHNISQNG